MQTKRRSYEIVPQVILYWSRYSLLQIIKFKYNYFIRWVSWVIVTHVPDLVRAMHSVIW